jgi:hypothetical protein
MIRVRRALVATRRRLGAGRLRKQLAAVGLAGLLAGTAAVPAPATGQPGAAAVPHISSFALVPATQGYTAFVRVVELAGGEPLGALDVRLKGAGRISFAAMAESPTTGTYTLALPTARPGWVRLVLRLGPGPGAPDLTTFSESYARTLRAGDVLHVVGSSPSSGSADATPQWLFVGGIVGFLVVLFICSVLAIRSRARAPQRALSNT